MSERIYFFVTKYKRRVGLILAVKHYQLSYLMKELHVPEIVLSHIIFYVKRKTYAY